MITIPNRQTKKIIQLNRSKILGDVWSTFNIDLQDNLGVIKAGNKLKLNVSSATETNLECAVAFKHFDGLMWTVAGSRVFKTGANNLVSAFTEDVSSGAVTAYSSDYSDLELAFGTLVSTTSAAKLYSKAIDGFGTGAWTERATLNAGDNHKLLYFKKFDRLYVSAYSTLIASFKNDWTYSTTGDYTLDLTTTSGKITCLGAGTNTIWIGTINVSTGNPQDGTRKVSVYEWDGQSAAVYKDHKIDAEGVMALLMDNEIPIIMDNRGILREFQGDANGFVEIGRLPFGRKLLINSNSAKNDRWMHPNGLIKTANGTYQVLVNNLNADNAGTINENLASGIWEFDRATGSFTHKHSISYMPMASSTITDYGQNRVSRVGALASANLYSTSASGRSSIVCGVTYFTDASTTASGIFIDAPDPTDNVTTPEGQKFAYFVTSWAMSLAIKDVYKAVILKYRQLLNSADKYILKYRLTEAAPIEVSITWVNTTSFTTSTNLTSYAGYEVEIIQGTGSGKCAHISTVTGSGPYTVTLDDTFTGVTTATAKARIQAWKKLTPEITGQTEESKSLNISKTQERIQVKCCMQVTGDNELYELIINNEPLQLTT